MKEYFRSVSRILGFAALACLTMAPRCDPPPCQPYGSNPNGGSPSAINCCTSDDAITSVGSGFCEGRPTSVPPDDPATPEEDESAVDGSETSLAFVPAWTDAQRITHPGHLLVAYNHRVPLAPGAGSDLLGWAFSTDQGRNWTARERADGGIGGGPVPDPVSPFRSYASDVSIVALGRPDKPGVVAMVTLGSTVPCATFGSCPFPDLVVLLVSIDGGETFSKTSVVNTGVGIGITDQPRVTVDPTDGSIWVLWRARTPILPAPFYAYVRGGTIDAASGDVTWNMNDVGRLTSLTATPDFQHPRINVFKRPGARMHTVAIVGPQATPGTALLPARCIEPVSGVIRNSFWQVPLGVFFSVSEDNGNTWGSDLRSAEGMGQPYSLGCVGGVGGRDATGQLIAADNRIDLARDPSNNNYLITRTRADPPDGSGFFVRQQVEIWRRSTVPGARFTLVKLVPLRAGNSWQWNPSIAARTDGQIAVSYYEAVGSSLVAELMVIGSRDGGTHWSTPIQLSANAPSVATDRDLGEYDEIIALPESVLTPLTDSPGPQFWPGMFYASWSNGDRRVRAAGFSPPPRAP